MMSGEDDESELVLWGLLLFWGGFLFSFCFFGSAGKNELLRC